MAFAMEFTSAGFRHCGDDASQGAAVCGISSAGLDLNLLSKLGWGILTGPAVDEAVYGQAVYVETVLGAPCAVHLQAAFNVAGTDRRCGHSEILEASGFRQALNFIRPNV